MVTVPPRGKPGVIEIPKLSVSATFASQNGLPFNVSHADPTVQGAVYVHVTDANGNELLGESHPPDKYFQLFEIMTTSSLNAVSTLKRLGGGDELVGSFDAVIPSFSFSHKLELPLNIKAGQLYQWPFLLVVSPAGTQALFARSSGAALLSMAVLVS